jgi:hypothetical protein
MGRQFGRTETPLILLQSPEKGGGTILYIESGLGHHKHLCTGGAYYVPYSCLLILISFVMGGGGGGGATRAAWLSSFMHRIFPSRAIMFLYAPAPPPPTVWALKPPKWAPVHKTTYAPMIYTALFLCFGCEFFGPQIALAYRLDAFHRAQKFSISRAQSPPTCPSNGYLRIQNIKHGLYK